MTPQEPANSHSCAGLSIGDARGLRIAVVTSCYHSEICAALQQGARDSFVDAGGEIDALIHVSSPGAFELVVVSAALVARADIDAVVALGCVLTGETSHDRFICDAVAQGLTDLSLRAVKPVAFGLLTCLTMEQARARAGGNKGNKGSEAMRAAIAAARTIQAIRAGASSSRSCCVGARQ